MKTKTTRNWLAISGMLVTATLSQPIRAASVQRASAHNTLTTLTSEGVYNSVAPGNTTFNEPFYASFAFVFDELVVFESLRYEIDRNNNGTYGEVGDYMIDYTSGTTTPGSQPIFAFYTDPGNVPGSKVTDPAPIIDPKPKESTAFRVFTVANVTGGLGGGDNDGRYRVSGIAYAADDGQEFGFSAESINTVPEPSAFILGMLGFIALLRRRK